MIYITRKEKQYHLLAFRTACQFDRLTRGTCTIHRFIEQWWRWITFGSSCTASNQTHWFQRRFISHWMCMLHVTNATGIIIFLPGNYFHTFQHYACSQHCSEDEIKTKITATFASCGGEFKQTSCQDLLLSFFPAMLGGLMRVSNNVNSWSEKLF